MTYEDGSLARACTGMDIEPTTHCPVYWAINPTALRYAPSVGTPCGLLTLNLRSHWSNPREESKNKSMVVDHALVFGSPARACTGMDIEPTTPCNNPTDFVALRQLRKFALSASAEGQTLWSAALRAAIC